MHFQYILQLHFYFFFAYISSYFSVLLSKYNIFLDFLDYHILYAFLEL